jgi:integrase
VKGKPADEKAIAATLGEDDQQRVDVLQQMFARKRGHLETVPDVEWLKNERPDFDFLDFEEADRLVKAADGEWRTMILVALRTGMRHGELIGLRRADHGAAEHRLGSRRHAEVWQAARDPARR